MERWRHVRVSRVVTPQKLTPPLDYPNTVVVNLPICYKRAVLHIELDACLLSEGRVF